MKWKRIAAPTIFLSCLIVFEIGCSGIGRTDCNQKIQEIRAMIDTTIMDYGDYEVMLPPCTYCFGDEIENIFAVPNGNMVGTNDLDNAIKLLEFKNDEDIEQHVVKKDFMEEVTGAYYFRFMPVWSEKEIAYAQSKGFLIVNIPDKKVEIHTVSPGIYTGNIENLAILNAVKRIFVLEIDEPNAGVEGFDKILKVIRFENGTFTVLAEHPAGIKTGSYTEPWFVYQNKIFIYNDSATKLEVYDELFTPVSHPLAEAFNQNSKNFRQLFEIAIHPILPIALIVETGKNVDWKYLESLPMETYEKVSPPLLDESSRRALFLLRWQHEDVKKQIVPLILVDISIWKSYNPKNAYANFSFSPDGKWVTFRDLSDNSKNPVFVAVPIDEKNPLYLGKPIKLGNAMREDAIGPTGTAWTTNPTAFVMCDGMIIYRWNLDRYNQLSKQKVKMPPDAKDPFVGND